MGNKASCILKDFVMFVYFDLIAFGINFKAWNSSTKRMREHPTLYYFK